VNGSPPKCIVSSGRGTCRSGLDESLKEWLSPGSRLNRLITSSRLRINGFWCYGFGLGCISLFRIRRYRLWWRRRWCCWFSRRRRSRRPRCIGSGATGCDGAGATDSCAIDCCGAWNGGDTFKRCELSHFSNAFRASWLIYPSHRHNTHPKAIFPKIHPSQMKRV
jgi:hypothetical protein